MSLLDLISALGTQDVNVKVIDSVNETTIIEFKSAGISGVESDVSARPVTKWMINGATAITVKLGTVETSESNP